MGVCLPSIQSHKDFQQFSSVVRLLCITEIREIPVMEENDWIDEQFCKMKLCLG